MWLDLNTAYIEWAFLLGNQAFIRETKFKGLVSWLLKQGQPGFFLNTIAVVLLGARFPNLKCKVQCGP